jgi:uncharacterized membrane protein
MENLTHYPLLVLATAFVTLWLAYVTGSWLRRNNPSAGDEHNEDIGVILAATLTLLALIIGFSFSMATNRYDQRKNSQGYTQAAFWNRIPTAAWLLMAAIALCSNLLFGYRSRKGATRKLSTVLPFVISIAMLLIADIDAPRHGLIRISPQNLESLAKSLGR